MEKKKNNGKYVLVFEPKYSYCQYAVYFNPDGTSEITQIYKNSDLPCDPKRKTIKKNNLEDIDKITTALPNLSSFFDKYVPSNIFSYNGSNLHNMFIAYKYNGNMYRLNYILNNPMLLDKTNLVKGNKCFDHAEIRKITSLILESKNNSFYKFIKEEKEERRTDLSKFAINEADNLRISQDNGAPGSEVDEIRKNLEERLTSYKEYRAIFCLAQSYQTYLEKQKLILNQSKRLFTMPNQNNNLEFEQLSLLGCHDIEAKIKNKNYKY